MRDNLKFFAIAIPADIVVFFLATAFGADRPMLVVAGFNIFAAAVTMSGIVRIP